MNFRDPKIKGVITPIVTPLTNQRIVDKQSVRKIIKFLEPKVDAIIPCLSTGEGRHLDHNTWCKMLDFSLYESAGLLVIAGIEQRRTQDVITRAKIAKSMGINTIAALPPFGRDIPQEKIYEHFARIAELNIQILVYNKKLMSGTGIDLETLVRICGIPNVVAVKEGSAEPQLTQRLLEAVEGVAILQAWEDLLTKTRTHGSIIPLSHLEPELCREALNNPSIEVQGRIDGAVSKYNIQGENQTWYSDVKTELQRRGIILTNTLVHF